LSILSQYKDLQQIVFCFSIFFVVMQQECTQGLSSQRRSWLLARQSVKLAVTFELQLNHLSALNALVHGFDSLLSMVHVTIGGIVDDGDRNVVQTICDNSYVWLLQQTPLNRSDDALLLRVFSVLLFSPSGKSHTAQAITFLSALYEKVGEYPCYVGNMPTMTRAKMLWILALLLQRLGNAKLGLKMLDRSLTLKDNLAVRTMREEYLMMTTFENETAEERWMAQKESYRAIIRRSVDGGNWLTKCYAYLGYMELFCGESRGHRDIRLMNENRVICQNAGFHELQDDAQLCDWVEGNATSVNIDIHPPRFMYKSFCVRCRVPRGGLKFCGGCQTILYCSLACEKCVSPMFLTQFLIDHCQLLTTLILNRL
jgi:hypothetical protein